MKNCIVMGKDSLLQFSQADLKNLGRGDIGYIKRYNVNGKPAWVVHAADGTALAVQKNAEAARLSAEHQSLGLVAVH